MLLWFSAAADTAPLKEDCIGCGDTSLLSDFVKTSCQHLCCQGCFQQLNSSKQVLGISETFHRNAVILSCLSKRSLRTSPLYCAIKNCAVRIPTENIDGFRAECALCHKFICTPYRSSMPKNPSHVHECKLDQDQKTFLALARESRFGRLATNVEE